MKYLLLLFLSVSAYADYGLPQYQDPSKSYKCWKKIQNQIDKDEIEGKWRAKLNPKNSFMYMAPTSRVGRWWILDKEEGFEILVKETAFDRVVLKYPLKNCQPEMAHVVFSNPLKSGFTDASLAQTIEKNKSGLVYTWSPGMGFSLDGMKAIQKAAEKNKLSLSILTDPNADIKTAKEALSKAGLKDITIIPNTSMDLRFRNALIHFPNLMMYKDGKMVDVIVPGVMGAEQYAEVINSFMEKK
ncbi:MAG: hypothetical protein K2P81_13340 [Bacteriovoracaceae bacterium]|nr:hypothetical protein [Bacteriovoracaceae bacterium]